MKTSDILSNLCYYDTRNPEGVIAYKTKEEIEKGGYSGKSRKPCACDKCFYGKSELASYILEIEKAYETNELLPTRNLNRLSDIIHKNNREKGFYDKEKNIGEMLCLIHSEVSEALEAHRNGKHSRAIKEIIEEIDSIRILYEGYIKGSFEEEMADIIIRVLDMCAFLKIDISSHVSAKVMYNKTRGRLHGKNY